MAIPTPLNGQITDAVTQTNVLNVASMQSNASGNLANAASQAFALMMENATAHQPHGRAIMDAAAARCVALLAR
ncbi:MAG: RebB family R body protein [Rhizomicrobium sp.]